MFTADSLDLRKHDRFPAASGAGYDLKLDGERPGQVSSIVVRVGVDELPTAILTITHPDGCGEVHLELDDVVITAGSVSVVPTPTHRHKPKVHHHVIGYDDGCDVHREDD